VNDKLLALRSNKNDISCGDANLQVRASLVREKDRQCKYNVTLMRVRMSIVTVNKTIILNILVCFCVRALVVQHVNRIIPASYYLSSVSCPALLFFFSHLINGTIFIQTFLIQNVF